MGSRYDASGYGSSQLPDGYSYGSVADSGMRSSDAAGSYRAADDEPQLDHEPYTRELSRRTRRSQASADDDTDGAGRPSRPESKHVSALYRSAFSRSSRMVQPDETDIESESEQEAGVEDDREGQRARLRKEAATRLAGRGTTVLQGAAREEAYDEGDAPRHTDARSYYSRSSSNYIAEQPKTTKRTVAMVVGVIVAIILIGAVVAYAYVSGIMGKMSADDATRAELVPTDMANEPFYVLLLGTDKSAEREDTGDFAAYRTDSMILARIDPVDKKVTMVSIPRDTLVDLGEYGYQRINAAYAYGGPPLAIKAVSQLAGVDISHYAEIDFDGFAAMVDALGGVEVDVPVDIDDWEAGGSVSAGLHTLNGDEALILCRSRATYADTAAAPDLMRAANQRLVLSAIAHKLLASDIGTIATTVTQVADYVITDLALNDIIGLAQIMQGLDADNDIYTASFPTESVYIANGFTFADSQSNQPLDTVDPNIDEGFYLLPDEDGWKGMKKRMSSGEPPSTGLIVDEATGTVLATAGADAVDTTEKYSTVLVKNATDVKGAATRTAKALEDIGFQNVMVGEINDNFSYPNTLVIYDNPSKEYEANLIASTMGQGKAMINDGSYLFETDFLVIIGDDWQADDGSSQGSS